MTFNKISKLADKFERKLSKYAQTVSPSSEVDSTVVTLAVRPTTNTTLTTMKFGDLINKAVTDAAVKLTNSGKELHGDIKISSFTTNATSTGGKWKIDTAKSGLKVGGTLMTDPIAAAAIKTVVSAANAKIIPLLETQFNKQSGMDKEGWTGTTITNHSTDINETSAEL
jgi:hypothetical protein